MALPTLISVGALTTGVGAISVPWGASHAADDLGVLVVETAGEAVATPSGWTAPANNVIDQLTAATRLTVFYRIATSGAESDAAVADPGNHAIAAILVFRGSDLTNPIPLIATSAGPASTTAGRFPGLVTQVADCMILNLMAWAIDASAAISGTEANADLTNLTERLDAGSTDGDGGGIVAITGEKATAGGVRATTTVITSTGYCSMTVVIQPPQTAAAGGMSKSRVVNA
jgi:hypothetical protein